jgi:hypothetical protein
LFFFIMSHFDWPIKKKSETLEAPKNKKLIRGVFINKGFVTLLALLFTF